MWNPVKILLLEKDRISLVEQAEYIKSQISEIKKDNVRVVLFTVPGESIIDSTLSEKQTKWLIKSLFPASEFEWLPEPPVRKWKTGDGAHLVSSDAKDYAEFVTDRLLTTH